MQWETIIKLLLFYYFKNHACCEKKKCRTACPGPRWSLRSWKTLMLVIRLQGVSTSVWPKSQSRLKKTSQWKFGRNKTLYSTVTCQKKITTITHIHPGLVQLSGSSQDPTSSPTIQKKCLMKLLTLLSKSPGTYPQPLPSCKQERATSLRENRL